jgi:hypothetical protein
VTWTLLRNDLVPTALSVQELWYEEQPLQVTRYVLLQQHCRWLYASSTPSQLAPDNKAEHCLCKPQTNTLR